ncbi:Cytosolic sulfotransferase [Actinidia chinensis var. chinensis]|uniref:Sulfotransferase n=1 Tax=Actinidia chinensis var. chinensis TaxID=1590841 RepID=A0A2R6QHC1_ACTCC|nr:Cytosolic sulfotransferase [Actinidia chinensis var. chinensis]
MTARETSRVKEEEYLEETQHNFNEKLQTLPRERGWFGHLFRYQDCWLDTFSLKGCMLVQNHFRARPTDIILGSSMKTGTTWLRTLVFTTMNRFLYDFSSHPLLNTGPHSCFPCIDTYSMGEIGIKDLEALPSPWLLATHFPYTLLPEAVTASGSKFVYIWRDPKDVLVSMWQFVNKINPKEIPPIGLNEAFELFCKGISNFGPFWDHVLGYWKVCQETPNKMLFLKYEDMKREPLVELKKLADFMGHPFTMEEEKDGVVEKIVEFCSFEHLSNLEVNKTGSHQINRDTAIENRHFFRKGQIGESKIHLTSEMMDCIDRITQHKFNGSGLI